MSIPRYIIVSAEHFWEDEADSVSVFSLDCCDEDDCFSLSTFGGDNSREASEPRSEVAASDHTVLPRIRGDANVCSRLPRVPQRQQSFTGLPDHEESCSFKIFLEAPASPTMSCSSTLNTSSSSQGMVGAPPKIPCRQESVSFELNLSQDSPSESGDTTAAVVPSGTSTVDKPLRKPLRGKESRTAMMYCDCFDPNAPEQICVCPKAA